MARSDGKRPTPPNKKPSGRSPDLPSALTPSKSRVDRSDIFKKVAIYGSGLLAFGLVVLIALGVAGEDTADAEGVSQIALGSPGHREGPIDYDGVPAGGEHAAVPLNCGAYDAPVPSENAVHSLEHGAVWITYPPDADDAFVERIREYAGSGKVIVSPFEGQTNILVTAWGNRIEADDPDDVNISRFIREFVSSGDAPEPGGQCRGVGNPL